MFCYVVAFYLLLCSLATVERDLKIKWKFDGIVSEKRESKVASWLRKVEESAESQCDE
jgi:hypothetical protein